MRYYFFIALLLCCSMVRAQHTLLMLDKGNRKSAYYKVGDKIAFFKKGSGHKVAAEILDLRDSIIVFPGFEVRLKDISALYIDDKTKRWLQFKISQLSLLCGSIYIFADVANTGTLKNETMAVGGVLLGVGALARAIFPHRIKIKGRTRLRILKF